MLFYSDNMVRVNLGLLKPLWHLYLNLASKHNPLDHSLKPPLMLALTELFIAVETAAEVWPFAVFVTYSDSFIASAFYSWVLLLH